VGAFVSRQLSESQWGAKTVKQLADFLEKQDPALKGFDRKSIYRIIQFYETYRTTPIVTSGAEQLQVIDSQAPEIAATVWRQLEMDAQNETVATLRRQITEENIRQTILVKVNWSIHKILISRTKMDEERLFYLNMCIKENYSVSELGRQVSASLFERVMLSNQQLTSKRKEIHPGILNSFKDSYIFEFLNLPEPHNESDLQKGLIRQMKQFILELGKDFLFIGEEYKVMVGNRDFFIDLVFYHRGLQCLVAFDLKNEKFEPEHLGKINFYLEALDRDVKKENENPSIGILLCKDKDNEVVEYALNRSLSPTMVAEYRTQLPDKKLLQQKIHELFENNNKGQKIQGREQQHA
jgi:predicted nuclease of restriction endonuclease-like (RecB) superfamily